LSKLLSQLAGYKGLKHLFLSLRDDREKALKNQTHPVPKTVLFLTRPRGYADTGRN
jgi:hypothetical protein